MCVFNPVTHQNVIKKKVLDYGLETGVYLGTVRTNVGGGAGKVDWIVAESLHESKV